MLSDGELAQVPYGPSDVARVSAYSKRPLTDWESIQKALAKQSYVTLHVLWLEYKSAHPDAVEYSQLCKLCCDWRSSS